MKYILTILVALAASAGLKAQTITYTNVTGSSAITCSFQSLNFIAEPASATFTWTSANAMLTGSNVNITSPGAYTITGTASGGSALNSVTLSVPVNTFAPHAGIGASGSSMFGGPVISCASPSVQLNNNSTTGIPVFSGFPTNQPVVAVLWEGPSPQSPASYTSNYTASTPGVYTLNVQDLNNGCVSHTSVAVSDNRIYPMVQAPPPFSINCPDPTATISASVAAAPGALSYSWQPSAATVSMSANNHSITVNQPGVYTLTVTNTSNGCASVAALTVEVCAAIATSAYNKTEIQVFPNPGNGAYSLSLSNIGNNCRLDVYNALGENVLSQPVDGSHSQLDLTSERSGIYFIHVIRNGSRLCSARVVKQ